jgi:hypothetical protein
LILDSIFSDGVIASKLPFGSRTIIVLLLEKSSSNAKTEELFEWMISSGSKKVWATHFMIQLHGDERDAENILNIAWVHRILKVIVAVSDAQEAGALSSLNKQTFNVVCATL